MAIVELDDIVGCHKGGEVICCKCMEEDEYVSLKQNQLIQFDDIVKESRRGIVFYCDSCGALILDEGPVEYRE